MKLSDVPNHLREVMALYDILTGVGYEQDDLFICPSKAGISVSIFLDEIHHPFVAATTPVPDNDEFMRQWTEVIAAWNASSQDERSSLVEGSDIRRHAVALITQLTTLGILPDQVINFNCPFCGRHVQGNARNYSISHTVPTCEKFNQLEPIAFLRESRHAMAGN
jgi:UV DNA damage repair endonuclease